MPYSRSNRLHRLGAIILLFSILPIVLAACGTADAESPTATAGGAGASDATGEVAGQAITVGNIEANNPSKKIDEFQPFADYLAAHLDPAFNISEGRVVIGQDSAEMIRMMEDGSVDIYLDATIPSLEVCEAVGCIPSLRQWKGGTPDLNGVFVTTEATGITAIADLQGKVIMLEQPHSTVGHILPLVTIAEQGIPTRSVDNPEADVGPDEIGYYVSSGGQTSMNLLLNGEISALAIGSRAFKQFSDDVQTQVIVFDETVPAPSQLVSMRPGLNPNLASEIASLMIDLDQNDEGRMILDTMRETEKFETIPASVLAELNALYQVVKQTVQN